MVHLNVKTTGGKKYEVDAELDGSVADCKQALEQVTTVPPPQQRLIYKGKVLKDDQTLESYGVEADGTLFFVKGAAPQRSQPTPPSASSSPPAPAAANPPSTGSSFGLPTPPPNANTNANPFGSMFSNSSGGVPDMNTMQQQMMQNPEMMQQMMNNPFVQSMMNDPETMRRMMQSNPQIQQLTQQNPQLNHILNDPEMLRQTMEAMRNPQAMREMMRNQDTALRNIESHPEGFNALRRMYHDVQEPLMDATSSGQSAAAPAFTMPGVTGNTGTSNSSTETNTNTNASANTNANPWGPASTSTNNANPWGRNADANPWGHAAGGMPNQDMMANLMQSPMFQQAMEQVAQNPDAFVSQMERMNPQMGEMMRQNPQMRDAMRNPDFLRAATNPQNMQAMMQMQQAMSQLQGSGLIPDMGSMGGMGGMGAMGGMGNPWGGAAAGSSQQSTQNPEEQYASQLSQMSDMGFTDRERNIRALQATQGNVNAAVDRLLSGSI